MPVELEKLQSGVLGNRELYNQNLDDIKAAFAAGERASLVKLTDQIIQPFDDLITHRKSTLGVVETESPDVSTWGRIVHQGLGGVGVLGNVQEGTLCAINLLQLYLITPGYYEDPQYGVDTSKTVTEFVYAPTSWTSEQVDNAVNQLPVEIKEVVTPTELGLNPVGSWSSKAFQVLTLTLGYSGSMSLYARFKNRLYSNSAFSSGQSIENFGGIAGGQFVVNNAIIYPSVLLSEIV